VAVKYFHPLEAIKALTYAELHIDLLVFLSSLLCS